jgi:hypothetical protein
MKWALGAALAVVLAAFVPAVHAQDVPIDIAVEGDTVPGGAVTVTLTTTDGSTISSVAWEQVYGVTAALSGDNPLTVTLGPVAEYKTHLFHVLVEPPVGAEALPPYVPPEEGEFTGGLQNRFTVVGPNPYQLEEAGLVALDATVVTSGGTYDIEAEILTSLPWPVALGIQNVPVGLNVLLHGKTQDTYDWALTAPTGSAATLAEANTQNPEFTPDMMGTYRLQVTDLAAGEPVELVIYAGTWIGTIVGQDANGNPVGDAMCTGCHGATFATWAASGHAEIFSDNLNTSTHYGEGCLSCHTVGYNTTVANNGIDDQADWQGFLDSGMLHAADPNNWTTMLAQYPASAKLANIQCENCHGPQNTPAHTQGAARQNLSSDICGTCHGEPPRHGRFQQWQLSAHANYELAMEEGMSGSCAKCHTANGFVAWGKMDTPYDSVNNPSVSWTENDIHPITCQTCHDPHDVGTTSGGPTTNAQGRVYGDTPMLVAGFAAEDVGGGALCMTCHNGRRGLRNDTTYDPTDGDRAPHLGPQADVIMGQNVYFIEVGERSFHSMTEDSCVDCHMEATDPVGDLSYQLGGTNHSFYASPDICSECHSVVTAEDVQVPFEESMHEILTMLETAYMDLLVEQLGAGNAVEFVPSEGEGEPRTITSASELASVAFTEGHGRQGLLPSFTDGQVFEYPVQLRSINVVPPAGDPIKLHTIAGDYLLKSGWNYLVFHADGSKGVHHPSWITEVLEATIGALEGGGVPGGGSANPVACTSQYAYWTEIAANNQGSAGSVWRTDVAIKNNANSLANVEFILHTDNAGNVTGTGAIDPMAQGIFEDVIGDGLGFEGKGALEICSDQPLELVARIYNTSAEGTFGQALDGISYAGLGTGGTARLLGLRQVQGEFRTNINVTNTGAEEAEVGITLYATDGSEVHSYSLTVGSGMSVQDLEPFRTRANEPNVGWGFAEVKVLSGSGIITSASVIDSRTNDPTTIPPKM